MKQWILVLLALFLFMFLIKVPHAEAQCDSNANNVAFFEDSNFRGKCVTRELGNYPKPINFGMKNDSISSIRVGSNVQIYVCQDDFYRGKCELLISDDNNLSNNTVGNDKISSLKIQSRGKSILCEPNPDQIALFQDSNFKGACEVRGIGNYQDSIEVGLQNDTISSVKVGSKVQAILCRDKGFHGNCELFTENDPNLKPHGWNDQVSSARVQVKGQQDCLPERNQVSLFEHKNFLAPCETKNKGTYFSSTMLQIQNDSVSSVRIGQGSQAVLCTDDEFKGDCELFTSSDNNLADSHIGNDKVSSAKIQPFGFSECEPNANQVAFFMHRDFISPCEVKELGEYGKLSAIGVESISSVKVGTNVQACVFAGENFTLTHELISSDDSDLVGNTIGNDLIAAAKVQKRGDQCIAPTVPLQGFMQIAVFNCHTDMRPVHFWIKDVTANTAFVKVGTLSAQYVNGSCPSNSAALKIPLLDKHSFQFVAVDPDLIGCQGRNDPQASSCQRLVIVGTILGDKNSNRSFPITVN
jgi:hypothetical protein